VLDDLDAAALARLSKDGFDPCAIIETSAENFQAWLKHSTVLPRLVGTFAAQTLAARATTPIRARQTGAGSDGCPATNCKPKYRKPDGHFPFVRLKSHTCNSSIRSVFALVDILGKTTAASSRMSK
jgi:hypothetical protein